MDNVQEQTVPAADFDSLKAQATHLADAAEKNATEAKTALERIQSALNACAIQSGSDLVQKIASSRDSAEIEIGMAADLPNKAQACAQPGACQTVAAEVRPMMQAGAIENAQKRLDQARAAGCNITDLEKELEFYKWVRDAAAAIHSLADQCRFQDAINWSNKIPEQYRAMSLIQDQLARARIGARAVENVQQGLRKSQDAAQRGDRAQAEQFLKQAQWEANNDQRWYHCTASLLAATPGLTSPPPAAGGLVLTKTEVRPAHDEVGGVGNLRSHYANTATSAIHDFTATTSEGKFVRHVQTRFDIAMTFSGTSGVLRPGDTLTITVTGMEARTPAMDHDAPPGGLTLDVYGGGLEKVSSQSCHVGSGFSDGYHANCRSESVFKVAPGAEKVTVSFSRTGAMGTTATYTWEKPR